MGIEHANHLIYFLQESYKTSTDWGGKRYLGIYLDWDYKKREVHLSVISYVCDALKHFNHTAPRKPQDQPFSHVKPNYGAKAQYSAEDDRSTPLSKDEKRFIQEVVGTFIYNVRAVNAKMLPALRSIASQQAAPTAQTMKCVQPLLDYATTHPNAIITYRTSAMVITGYSDAS